MRRVVCSLIAIRVLLGVLLAQFADPLCIDDTFRVFYAAWWSEHPGFASYLVWLPGYSWLYGSWVAITQDLWLAPKLLSLGFQLLTGLVVGLWWPLKPQARGLAALLILFHPLALPLGSSPLSECASVFFLMLSLGGLLRARQSVGAFAISSFALFAATCFRYEFWILTPIAAVLLFQRAPRPMSMLVRLAVSALPFAFPAIWCLYGFLMQGQWLGFLTSVSDDHFGASQAAELLTPEALLALLLWAVGFVGSLVRTRRFCLETAVSALLMALIGSLILRHSLPSQYAARLFYAPSMVLLPELGRLWSEAQRGMRWAAFGFAFVAAFGAFLAFTHPSGGDDEARVVGRALSEELDASPDARALIARHMPENTSVFVFANRMGRIWLDGMGKHCPPDYFGQRSQEDCPALPQMDLLLVWQGSLEERMALQAGFETIALSAHWRMLRKL